MTHDQVTHSIAGIWVICVDTEDYCFLEEEIAKSTVHSIRVRHIGERLFRRDSAIFGCFGMLMPAYVEDLL